MLLDAQIKDVVQSPLLETGGRNQGADAGVHGEEPLQGEGAEALRDFPPHKALLKLEAPARPLLAKAVENLFGDVLAVPDHPETIGPFLKILMWKSGKEGRLIAGEETRIQEKFR